MGKSDSQQIPNKLLLGFQQTQPGCNLLTSFGELFWRDHIMNFKWTQGQLPSDSLQTMSTQFRELIPEESCFGRALLKSPFKELPWKLIIPWIPQIRLQTETQQTLNKTPKRLQPGLNLDTSFWDLNWIPHVESSFGELFWRDHEFIWFYLSKHKIRLNFLNFFCQKANLIWKNMISNL